MTTINVIGAGMAGSLVTHLLRHRGWQVRVFDDNDTFSGSRASSNLFIASWLKKFQSSSVGLGIGVLEDLFAGKIDHPFETGIGEALQVRHIAQRHLLVEPDSVGKVFKVRTGELMLMDGDTHEGPIVLCCGHRANELWADAHPGLDVLVGHCAFYSGQLPPGKASITMPLPYRHEKLYQFDEHRIYFADSMRLTRKSWEKDKVSRMNSLCDKGYSRGIRGGTLAEYRVGFRPVVPGHDFGQLRELAPVVWSLNGGGKNGLVAYAALAARLADSLGTPK